MFEEFLFLAELKSWLIEQPESPGALMSGTGSAMFAVVGNGTTGESLSVRAKEIFGETLWTWVGEAG